MVGEGALEILESKMVDGRLVVERVVPKLAGLSFCTKGEASELAVMCYHEILQNLNKRFYLICFLILKVNL